MMSTLFFIIGYYTLSCHSPFLNHPIIYETIGHYICVNSNLEYCFIVWIYLSRESIKNNEFSPDWDEMLLAFTLRIIFMFLTQKIQLSMLKLKVYIQRSWLKILNTYFLFLDLFWYLFPWESEIHFFVGQMRL